MARAGKISSESVKNKQASSNTPSELKPKSLLHKANNSAIISGGMRERKPRSHAQMIASILTKKRTGKPSEPRCVANVEDQKFPSTSKKTNANDAAGKLVKRTLQKASQLNLIKNESQKRPRKSSTLSSAAGKSECPQQRKTRRSKWKSDSKNMMKGKAEGTSYTGGTKRKQQRRKQKKKAQNVPLDEVLRVNRRIKYLFIKMKLEQTLIDAYSGEGWKGQSREKIRPEKELQRAENQILKCKLGIREAVHQLDLLGSEGRIADAVVDPEGRVFHEHIFCAKCKTQDTVPDNDIILCDGACNRGFHQKCLDPPLATENIPPGDQGWLCKVCECKLEALEAINAHLGTQFTVENSWEEIFGEAAKVANGENMHVGIGEEWPSDDSEDDDYDPEKQENINETGYENDTNSTESSCGSSESSEASDSESKASLTDDLNGYNCKGKMRCRDTDEEKEDGAQICLDSDENGGPDFPVSGRRQRKDVDYKKLNDEMFGKDESNKDELSEDEDWGPSRRTRRGKQPDTNAAKDPAVEAKKNTSKGEEIGAMISAGSMHDKKHIMRLPTKAVEMLRKVFMEDELPSKSYKENLSKQLGLTFRKVHMWFKNARYMALKNRKEIPSRDKLDETSHAGQGDLGPRKNLEKEKKSETECFSPSTGAEHTSRNIKGKHRRKDIKKSLGMPARTDGKRSMSRLPANAVARFRQVFAENELPSMSSKVALSKQLDIPYRQVHMWFKNARYMALKKKKISLKLSAPSISENSRECILASDSIPTTREPDDASNPYLTEMEKMGKIEVKLENLRNILEAICPKEDPCVSNDKAQEDGANHFNGELVMYVPVAELKEKILQVALVR